MVDKETVAVLGHRGYLGSVVARYFTEQGADVRTTDLRFVGEEGDRYRASIPIVEWAVKHDVIVNCIGGYGTRAQMMLINGDLPMWLGEHAKLRSTVIIQPSTDAIREDTAYAESKRAGECSRLVNIRSGIIKGDHGDPTSHVGTAYTDWRCNPITPLEWAQAAWSLRSSVPCLVELGGIPTSRYLVERARARAFGLPEPREGTGPFPTDRVMHRSTNRFLDVAIREWKEWSEAQPHPARPRTDLTHHDQPRLPSHA